MHRESLPFPDLEYLHPRFALLHSEAFFTSQTGTHFMYPAPAAVLYRVLYLAEPHIVLPYLCLGTACLAAVACLFARALWRRGVRVERAIACVALMVVSSYPVWFVLTQANLEIFLWALLVSGIALFWTGRGFSAAVLFGVAAAIKLYPAIFLVLPLYRKRWLEALAGLLAACLVEAGALAYVGPSLSSAWQGIQQGLKLFQDQVVLKIRDTTGLDHSLFALYKVILRKHASPELFGSSLRVYFIAMSLLVLVMVIRARRLPKANQVGVCIVTCVLAPPTSFEYTLLHILTFFGLLLLLEMDAAVTGQQIRGLIPAMYCCLVCQMFLPELIRHGVQFEGALKCVVLVLLGILVLRFPFPTPLPLPAGRRATVS